MSQFKKSVGVGVGVGGTGVRRSTSSRKSKSLSPVPGRRTGGTATRAAAPYVTLFDDDDDDVDIDIVLQSIVDLETRLHFSPFIVPNHFDISLVHGGETLTDDGACWVQYLSLSIPFAVEEDVLGGRTTLALDDSDEYKDPKGIGSSCLLLTRPVYSIAQQQAWIVQTRVVYEEYKEYHKNNDVNVTDAKLDGAREIAIKQIGSALAAYIDPETKLPRLVTYRLHLPKRQGEQLYVHTDYFQKRNWNSQPNGSFAFKPVDAIDFFEQPKCIYQGRPLPQTNRALVYRLPILHTESARRSLTTSNILKAKTKETD